MPNSMMCPECTEDFESKEELDQHFASHLYKTISNDPLVLIINLPEGCTPGRWEAAEHFADSFKEIQETHPDQVFCFIAFDHERSQNFGGVNAWLVIGQKP